MIDNMDRVTHIMRQETTPQLTVKQCNIYIHTYIRYTNIQTYVFTTEILCHVYVCIVFTQNCLRQPESM